MKTILGVALICLGGCLAASLSDQIGRYGNLTIIMAPYDTIQVGPNTFTNGNCSVPDDNNNVTKRPELYWKDYNGPPAPEDAILIGYVPRWWRYYDASIYVGQAVFNISRSGLQPVGVSNDTNEVNGTFHVVTSTNKNIKVLCTNVAKERQHTFLKWVPSYSYNYTYSTPVVTGYEENYTIGIDLYTGRAWVNGSLVVGKVVNDILYYPYLGYEESTRDFEILAYAN